MTSDDLRHLTWHTSSYSGNNGNCVEVAELPDGTRCVRDTKDRSAGYFTTTAGRWSAFISAVRSDRF
ncbi:DUF397 domain-containing protein [Saccharopolyspora sp. ASAGF58]|uniref:DUF397 domain-containing protein n=1 Tax=Saccharopolyspora sp. ASAGF58 TaxID=2719023 RepID=UPI001440122F|nr:DUF397 domain-containing protein [Saccharopolyspora sp. ASAGF58]QIZ34236.1 DUF397 domain-containing protein [Saccharopolyspora sp. ASAGF58]